MTTNEATLLMKTTKKEIDSLRDHYTKKGQRCPVFPPHIWDNNGYGGKFSYLFFKTSNKIYSVWVYPIDKGVYQVRELRPRDPSEKFKKHISKLRTNPKIVSLWQ